MPARRNRPDKSGLVNPLASTIPWERPTADTRTTVGHVPGGGDHSFVHVIWTESGRWDNGAVLCTSCGAWGYTTPNRMSDLKSADQVRRDGARVARAYGTSCHAVARLLTVAEVQRS